MQIAAQCYIAVHARVDVVDIGQTFQLAVIDKNSGIEVQRVSTVAAADFMVDVYGIENGMSYNVDFFADHNNNGKYDAPPADHAWRMNLDDVKGDTILMFMHNTTFTDINWITTSITNIGNTAIKIYPNPATDQITVEVSMEADNDVQVSIMDAAGRVAVQSNRTMSKGDNQIQMDLSRLNNGIYFVQVRNGELVKTRKLVVQ